MSRTHLLATGRAFLFDMDGTILDSNAIVEKLWRIFAKRHNLDADDILSFSHGRPSITTIAHSCRTYRRTSTNTSVTNAQLRKSASPAAS